MEAVEAGRNLLEAPRTKKPGTRNPEPGTGITRHALRLTSVRPSTDPVPSLDARRFLAKSVGHEQTEYHRLSQTELRLEPGRARHPAQVRPALRGPRHH